MDEEEKLSFGTREVPLYGLREHHVQLHNDTSHSEDEEFYVVIQGSRLTHVTAAKMGGDGRTLSFVVPGNDLPEAVSITPYRCFEDHFEPCGTEFSFQYVQDVAQDIAEYLNTKSSQLGPHSYLDIEKIFSEWTTKGKELSDCEEITDLRGHQFSDALRLLDERITQAMANLIYPLQWTETDAHACQCNEPAADHQPSKPLLHFVVNLGLIHLSRFVVHQLKAQRALTLPNQDGDTPLLLAPNEEHGIFNALSGSAYPVAGVCCVWSNSSSMLRVCPGTNSLTLTVQHTLGGSSHEKMLLTLRARLKDHATLKLVSAIKAHGETHQKVKEHSVDKVADPLLAVDDKCKEFKNTNRAEGVTAAMELNISGVTRDSTKTDSVLWDTEDTTSTLKTTDAMPPHSLYSLCQVPSRLDCSFSAVPVGQSDGSSTDHVDLSPSLVALELNSEDDGTEATSPVSPFSPDMDRYEDNFHPFTAPSCTRSLSASLSEHTSKEPKQDTRLRSYSYSSSKIGFRRGQSTRDVSPDLMDTVSYGRSLLQALSLSKSLSLLHPSKQKASCVSEQSQEKREISFRKRAQSADDEGSFELVQSLQHLTLSEFLKEIEEEELDKYNTPLKVESEKHKVIRTFSFLKNRMSTTRNRSKSKKDREAKDRQLNGHQFSTGLCLGPTMCVVCDKPATGKDYLHCSVCTAIVHKNCKESIPPCLKTFQNKYALPKTASLPQNFTIRESAPQYILPTSSYTPAGTPKDKKDPGPVPCLLSASVERLNEISESESDHTKVTCPSEDSATSPVYSISADYSPREDCVDTYIFKDILADAANYEAESWNSSVEHKFCRRLDKKSVKRQDVIYELMQTEIHHLQTLHVMAEVFRRGVKEEVQLDADAVERLFPCLDQLLLFHHGFFAAMKERRQNSLPQGQNNYLIQRIGDVLLQQFSDENGKRMTHLYGEFCSHHNEAVNFFKELLLNNKKFQTFIKQQGNNYLVRRREIPECILLVTQRITKYPVLLERILQCTQTGTEEHSDLSKALALNRELIAAVNQRVSKYEREQKLQEVLSRIENRSSAKLKNGHTFRKQDMMRPGQTLAHEGGLFWKSATGRLKDVLALLLTDTLIFLQEKDQKFVFAAVDQKPPVIALRKLIVREVANEDRGMFLISASSAGPEMYEVHACSKDERNAWMRLIREAVESCPEGEQDYTSESEEEKRAAEVRLQKIHRLQESLNSHDQQICSSLEEKLQIYTELSTITGGMDNSPVEPRLLVERHQEDMPQAALLLSAALQEAEILKTILSSKIYPAPGGSLETDVDAFSNLEVFPDFTSVTDAESSEEGWTKDSAFHSLMKMQTKDIDSKVTQRVQSLTQLLYSLKAAVTLQDSWYEVKRLLLLESDRPSPRPKRRPHFSSLRGNTLQEQEKQRNLEKQKEEVATAQRLQDQLLQEKERWERACHARESQQEEQERLLQEREKQCHLKAERLKLKRAELDAQLEEYQQNLERLREGQKSVEKERERLETQQKRLQIWKRSHQRSTVKPHMLIPLDSHPNTAVTLPTDPKDNGSVFVNEVNRSINNHHILHRPNDPSAHNCLNALLARSNSRRHPNVPPHPESDGQGWVMGSECFNPPAGDLGNEHTPADINRESFSGEDWASTSDFVLPRHSHPEGLLSTETDSSGEEPKEETIVYL